MAKQPLIALLTDFGTEDGYVGAMKGRIMSELASAKVTDVSHSIQPFNVRQAAFCLNNSYPYFPEKTVFVVVVDPGVGTVRKGLVIKTSRYHFVGPDNGVFIYVYRREGYQASEILLEKFTKPISPTFHGRDVFARIGARLAEGKNLSNYLTPVTNLGSFLKPPRKVNDKEMALEVAHVDHFGNLILNLHKSDLLTVEYEYDVRVKIGNAQLNAVQDTFGKVPPGELLLTWDSSGFLQIAQNMGSAAKTLSASIETGVQLFL